MSLEAPTFGQKIDIEKVNQLILEFRELMSEEEIHDNNEQIIKHFGMFIESKKKGLTLEEIDYLKDKLLPSKKVKAQRHDFAPVRKGEKKPWWND